MKKHINKISLLALAALSFGLSSCDDYLDELPDNRMELKTPEEVSNLLVSAYSEAHPAYLFEMYSDNSDCIDNTGWTEADRFQRQAFWWDDITETQTAESPQELWNSYYSAVAAANASIEHIDKQSADKLNEYSAQLGEALMCRAYNMFMLSTVFCEAYDKTTAGQKLGLPYPEKPETKVGEGYERGTLAELYDKIDKDLQRGLPLVGSSYAVPKYHFNPNAAYAFATRFYLYYQDYDKAIEYATKVLGNDPAAKLRDWTSLSAVSVNKMIMPEKYIETSENANLMLVSVQSEWGAINGPYILGDRYAHGQVLSETETLQSQGPWGSSNYFRYGSVWHNNSLSKYMHRKIPYEFEYTDLQAGIGYAHAVYSVFNTDMVLLERAEAYAMKGEYEKAVADINTELAAFHRLRPTVTVASIAKFYGNDMKYYTPTEPTVKKQFHTSFAIEKETQEPMLHCILHLRRILTMHEGIRMQDIKRYGITIYRRTLNKTNDIVSVTDTMDENDPRRAIQLPQDVISAGLQANPRK